jgi:hypothetical protein
MDTMHEEKNHLVGFSFIRVLEAYPMLLRDFPKNKYIIYIALIYDISYIVYL